MRYNIKIGFVVVCYIWFTFLLFLISPITYPLSNKIDYYLLTGFLILVSIAFLLGCVSVPIPVMKVLNFRRIHFPYIKLIIVSTSLYVLLIIDAISLGIFKFSLNLGETYIASHAIVDNAPISGLGKMLVLSKPVTVMALSLGFYNFSHFNRKEIWLFTLFIFTMLTYSIGVFATQKEAGDIIIVSIVSFFIFSLQQKRYGKFYKYALFTILLFIAFFIFNQLSRTQAYEIESFRVNSFFTVDNQSWIYKIFGDTIGDGVVALILYLSHGYQGLGLCLKLPYEWTHGYGSSMALSSYLHQYFGLPDLINRTYPLRMEFHYGWPGLMFWPTAFSWWASDISFTGVVILMFFIGRFFCICFKEAYLYNNPISITLTAYLSILLIYLPLNNQLFQTRNSLVASSVLFLLWIIFHKKYNKIRLIKRVVVG
jgi:hypothetical protein